MSSKKGRAVTIYLYTHLDRVDYKKEKLTEWRANVTVDNNLAAYPFPMLPYKNFKGENVFKMFQKS